MDLAYTCGLYHFSMGMDSPRPLAGKSMDLTHGQRAGLRLSWLAYGHRGWLLYGQQGSPWGWTMWARDGQRDRQCENIVAPLQAVQAIKWHGIHNPFHKNSNIHVKHKWWRTLIVDIVVSLTDTIVDASGSYSTISGLALREFLMPDKFSQDGVLFAFVAYFVSLTPVRLQVWRPVGTPSSTDSYQLVCERRIEVTRDQLSRRSVVRSQHSTPMCIKTCLRWTDQTLNIDKKHSNIKQSFKLKRRIATANDKWLDIILLYNGASLAASSRVAILVTRTASVEVKPRHCIYV